MFVNNPTPPPPVVVNVQRQLLVQFKLLLCYHLHRSSLRNLCHCLYVATIIKTNILFLPFYFLPLLVSNFFFCFFFGTTNCKCHFLNHARSETAVPRLLLQLSKKKKRKEKKRKTWLPVILSVIKSWKKNANEVEKTIIVCLKRHLQNKCISA